MESSVCLPRRAMMTIAILALCFLVSVILGSLSASAAIQSPDEAIALLKAGNTRFLSGTSIHPHVNAARLLQAGIENQGDHAYATVMTCSDSRVPVEILFDAGVMDIFVIRVAGNVSDTDEIGSIEYGLAHVNTPVMVVLGHTQCGAVTAVTHAVQGTGHTLERNIPPLVDNIEPAVRKAMKLHADVHGDAIISYAIEENVWQSIEDLFMRSPSTRELVHSGKTKVVGAVYDVGSGRIEWLPEGKPLEILAKVEENPNRAMNVMAEGGHNNMSDNSSDHGGDISAAKKSAVASSTIRSFYPDIKVISTDELYDRFFTVTLIDVRRPSEFDVVHIEKTVNLSLESGMLMERIGRLTKLQSELELVFVSNDPDCPRAFEAARIARRYGLTNVKVYDGGVFSWLHIYPERSWLMGKGPAQLESILPLTKHQEHLVSFDHFNTLSKKNDTLTIDIRDTFRRQYIPTGLSVRNIAMHPLLVAISNRVWAEKCLLIFDEDGSRTRWLQLFLQASGYHDYFFLEGGVNSLEGRKLRLLSDTEDGQLSINQERLREILAKLWDNPNVTSFLGYVLASVQFENIAFISLNELRNKLEINVQRVEELSRDLVESHDILFFQSGGNYIFRVNPTLAWKGEMSGRRWEEKVAQYKENFSK